jgi:Two component regulator propeller
MTIKLLITIFLFTFLNKVSAQLIPGEWKDLLPYHMTKKVAVGSNRIYCCSSNSLFYYDLSDKSINRISKVQGLSEVEISTIAYAPKMNFLIIAYSNSNIDILDNKNRISNLPYIKNKTTIPARRIYNIMVVDNNAYLSCDFGIAVLDLDKLQIKDTYYPGNIGSTNKVNYTCTDGRNIYAATSSGIYKALINDPFLADFSHWSHYNNFPTYLNECNAIEYFAGKLFAMYNTFKLNGKGDSIIYLANNVWFGLKVTNFTDIYSINVSSNKLFIASSKGVYTIAEDLSSSEIWYDWTNTFAVGDENGNVWIADLYKSLIEISKNGNSIVIEPNSPFYPNVYKMDTKNGKLWTVAGSKDDAWEPQYNFYGAQSYIDNIWTDYSIIEHPEFQHVQDIVNVKINPLDDEIVFMASWQIGGLLEYNHGHISFFKANNSTIQPYFYPTGKDTMYRLDGLSFDNSNNLWITNSLVKNQLLVYTANHKWKSFYLGKTTENIGKIGDVLATSWGHKWIFMPKSTSINIYDDNNTPENSSDDRDTMINFGNIESLITSTAIYCIAEDRQGVIYVGTDAGPVRFTSPQEVFNETGPSPQKIKVAIVKGQSTATFLLETERINAIAIDGANRKWFGTQNSGAYLISENDNQIVHFTSENSPLLSNTIQDITIDHKSGVVYFATDKGLISYRGFATEGGQEFGKVYVYPNPVHEYYKGNIIVTGLIEDAIVKITDISGNIVNETKALGGQAIWNGKNLLGKRVNTGVYLVFCSNSDGSKTYVTKLLFIH